MKHTRKLALCGVVSAMTLAVLLIGSVIGVGTYAAPLFASLMLMPVGMSAGTKSQLLSWLCVGLLSLILLTDREEAFMFLLVFGWYPAVRPYLERLKKPLGTVCKLLSLNIAAVGTELLVIWLVMPEAEAWWLWLTLWAVANVIFVMYDSLIPRFEALIRRRFGKYL